MFRVSTEYLNVHDKESNLVKGPLETDRPKKSKKFRVKFIVESLWKGLMYIKCGC